MLVNPGGPGASGLGLSVLGQYVPQNVGATYDWIGWDPRGVGASTPALSCKPNYLGYDRPPYVPRTAKLLATWKAKAKAYAVACAKAHPTLIKHVKTRDSVKDMESIRVALGAPQINYYGFSYGTYLGSAYASLHPTKMRRMVLDGNVDPRQVWYKANLDQDVAFNKNIKIWFAWVAKYHGVYHLGSTEKKVEAQYYKQLHRLDRKAAGGVIGGDEWTDVFVGAGYYQVTWPELADAFSAWVNDGDWQLLKDEYDASATPGDDNGYAMYSATQCTDAKWPTKWSTWQKDNDRIYKKAKFLTWDNAWYNAPCLYWKAKPGTPVKIGSAKVTSALLVSETLDAATPFEGSLELRKRFPHSSLIAEPGGTTHAGSLFGNACVDDTIATYLATGARPARQAWRGPDKLCKPLPRPTPAGSSSEGLKQALTRASVPALRDLVGRP
jgi:pimeloyl-ACP methyl ester carboxylesterase